MYTCIQYDYEAIIYFFPGHRKNRWDPRIFGRTNVQPNPERQSGQGFQDFFYVKFLPKDVV